jgi:hypothetical protein
LKAVEGKEKYYVEVSNRLAAFKYLDNEVKINSAHEMIGHFCGLEVRVPDYRSRSSGFDSRLYQIF